MVEVELTIRGNAVRVADSPEQLVRACGASFASPEEGVQVLANLRAAWARGAGLIVPGGGCFLENLGDGVFAMSLTADGDPAQIYAPVADYAFTATDAQRIITSTDTPEGAALLEQQGYVIFNASELGEDGVLYHLALDLDAWLVRFGPRLFYVEACRMGQADKAARVLDRWARFYGDPSVLRPDIEAQTSRKDWPQVRDWFAEEFGRRWALAAPTFGEADFRTFSLDHLPTCKDPQLRLDCPCGLIVSFIGESRVVRVDGNGEVSLSHSH